MAELCYRFVDGAGYFSKTDRNRDGKLSWREIKRSRLDVKGRKKPKPDKWGPRFCGNGIPKASEIKSLGKKKITLAQFRAAQSSKYDNDPKKLNYREFQSFLMRRFKIQDSPGLNFKKRHCDDNPRDTGLGSASPALQRKARAVIRKGIETALKDTWAAKKKSIQRALKQKKIALAITQLTKYFPIVAESAHYSNRNLHNKVCYVGCVCSLWEIEEFASRKSLKNLIIKRFWSDVDRLLIAYVKKAKASGQFSNFKAIWKPDKIRYVENTKVTYATSNYTLFTLMKKARPSFIKRAKAIWGP